MWLGQRLDTKSRRSLDARFKSREDRNCRRSSNILDDVQKVIAMGYPPKSGIVGWKCTSAAHRVSGMP